MRAVYFSILLLISAFILSFEFSNSSSTFSICASVAAMVSSLSFIFALFKDLEIIDFDNLIFSLFICSTFLLSFFVLGFKFSKFSFNSSITF